MLEKERLLTAEATCTKSTSESFVRTHGVCSMSFSACVHTSFAQEMLCKSCGETIKELRSGSLSLAALGSLMFFAACTYS